MVLLAGFLVTLTAVISEVARNGAATESYIARGIDRVTYMSWSGSDGELRGIGHEASWSEEHSDVVIEDLVLEGIRREGVIELTVTYPDGTTRQVRGVEDESITFYDAIGDGSSSQKVFSQSDDGEYLKAVDDLSSR